MTQTKAKPFDAYQRVRDLEDQLERMKLQMDNIEAAAREAARINTINEAMLQWLSEKVVREKLNMSKPDTQTIPEQVLGVDFSGAPNGILRKAQALIDLYDVHQPTDFFAPMIRATLLDHALLQFPGHNARDYKRWTGITVNRIRNRHKQLAETRPIHPLPPQTRKEHAEG